MTKYAFIMVTSVLAAIGTAAASTCGDFKDCSSCAAEADCMWALLYNCTELCMSTNYRDPDTLDARNVIWRSAVSDSAECASKEECSIIAGAIGDPSLEDTTGGPWIYYDMNSKPVKTGEYSSDSPKPTFDTALDGKRYVFMGRGHLAKEGKVYSARLDKVRIPRTATHLSFFYAFPFFSGIFEYKKYFLNDRAALSVFMDKKLILHLSNKTVNTTRYMTEKNKYYHPMNIDIKEFADDKDHSLEFFFIEAAKAGSTDTNGQGVIFDYVQIISSNSKKYILYFIWFLLFLLLIFRRRKYNGWIDRKQIGLRYLDVL